MNDGSAPRVREGWAGAAGYVTLLAGGLGLFFLIRWFGEGLTAPPPPPDAVPVGQPQPGQVDVVLHVTATLAAVIALGALLGWGFRHLGQPPVIGEVVAGL